MKRRFNLTARAAFLLLGIVTARYANDRAVENALIAYPPRIECSKLLKGCQHSFFTKAIRAANHVIVTGCTIGGDRIVLVTEKDGSIFVPLGAEGYIDLPNARTVYARLMPTLVTGPLFDVNGYLVAKDEATYAPFPSTVWPEAVSIQVDGVAAVETQRLIPIIGWLSLAIAAMVAAAIYLI